MHSSRKRVFKREKSISDTVLERKGGGLIYTHARTQTAAIEKFPGGGEATCSNVRPAQFIQKLHNFHRPTQPHSRMEIETGTLHKTNTHTELTTGEKYILLKRYNSERERLEYPWETCRE